MLTLIEELEIYDVELKCPRCQNQLTHTTKHLLSDYPKTFNYYKCNECTKRWCEIKESHISHTHYVRRFDLSSNHRRATSGIRYAQPNKNCFKNL